MLFSDCLNINFSTQETLCFTSHTHFMSPPAQIWANMSCQITCYSDKSDKTYKKLHICTLRGNFFNKPLPESGVERLQSPQDRDRGRPICFNSVILVMRFWSKLSIILKLWWQRSASCLIWKWTLTNMCYILVHSILKWNRTCLLTKVHRLLAERISSNKTLRLRVIVKYVGINPLL